MIANTERQRIGEIRIEKRGGSGPASKLTPDPHTKHSPEAIVQGVRE
jgi:hypothetical protein